jgi:hypothetical protein
MTRVMNNLPRPGSEGKGLCAPVRFRLWVGLLVWPIAMCLACAGQPNGRAAAADTHTATVARGAITSRVETWAPMASPTILVAAPRTVTPSLPENATLRACLANVMPRPWARDSHSLRVVYSNQNQFLLWKEETGSATVLGLVDGAQQAIASSDGRLVAYQRRTSDNHDQIWVLGTDGSGERQVALADPLETWERYPLARSVELRLGWLPNSHTVWYYYVPQIDPPRRYEALYLVDTEGGSPRLVLPAGVAWKIAFSPNGHEIIALAESELRLIDVRVGLVLHNVPLPEGTFRAFPAVSPDGRYVIVFTPGNLTVVDATNGQRHDIPLQYSIIPSSMSLNPPLVAWLEQGPVAHIIVAEGPNLTDQFRSDATFTVWRVDVAQGTLECLHAFYGIGLTNAVISPDGRWLAYIRRTDDDRGEICLADMNSGQCVVYDQLELPVVWGWEPDAVRWIYKGGHTPLKIGQVCGVPLTLPEPYGDDSDVYHYQRTVGRDEFITVQGRGPSICIIRMNEPDGCVRTIAEFPVAESSTFAGFLGCYLGD